MPEVIDTNNPHTLIVRWDDPGNVCEAQFFRLRHVEIDGEVVKHEVTGPTILNHTDLANVPEIAAVNTDALASVNSLTAERDTLRTDLETATKRGDDLDGKLSEMTTQAASLRTELDGAKTRLASLDDEITSLSTRYRTLAEQQAADEKRIAGLVTALQSANDQIK